MRRMRLAPYPHRHAGSMISPTAAANDPYATREIPTARPDGQPWTSGEVVGEGQGQGQRTDTGDI